ncbi:MAG: hypothetical protein M2R45_03824 [Verrucomicrobia subdivision 3 bacterium]|nr:hypothetical protein [Limisphaerales bacterium]MCS1415780.1 hypothetical protein [Limisphaerales bacterium]
MEHEFTPKILQILEEEFGAHGKDLFQASELLQYLNIKTKAASRGSKSRASFGNLYAVYVLVEDYLGKSFHESGNYKEYEGARFTDLLRRMRELPFGSKLQNYTLNHRIKNSGGISQYVNSFRYSVTYRLENTGLMRIFLS